MIPDWLPSRLVTSMRRDARVLFASGQFKPDGLTNTALRSAEEQGFRPEADRQTFRGGAGWDDAGVGDVDARLEFARRMGRLREDLASGLCRPTLSDAGRGQSGGGGGGGGGGGNGDALRHEMTYNWYEPGAKLGRHLDEHHEETKGTKGWMRPSRRSVTWLVYLNDDWHAEEEGGTLRCFPRSKECMMTNDVPVGAHEGNLQVGWVMEGGRCHPVFLDCFRPSGGAALYRVVASSSGSGSGPGSGSGSGSGSAPESSETESDDRGERWILSARDFDVPAQPIEFASFLLPEARDAFEQISTSRLDPRFAHARPTAVVPSSDYLADVGAGEADGRVDATTTTTTTTSTTTTILDVTPAAGTLVLFDSVTLPHLVLEVTGTRQRIAATGWFHEDSQFVLEV